MKIVLRSPAILRGFCAAAALFLLPTLGLAATHHASRPVPVHLVPRGPGKQNVTFVGKATPIRAVLALIFRRANQNYVFGPRVRGNVTASLNNVPFDTAVNQLIAANSVRLTKTMEKGIYVINVYHRPRPTRVRSHVAFRRPNVNSNNAYRRQQANAYQRQRANAYRQSMRNAYRRRRVLRAHGYLGGGAVRIAP